jgi:hypothetical protein
VGVATQDPLRQRALDVGDKEVRVANFHRNTLAALAEIVGAAGLDHPARLRPRHFMLRRRTGEVVNGDEAFPRLAPGALLGEAPCEPGYAERWRRARAESFDPVD